MLATTSERILGSPDPWHHSVDYTAAVCTNTYTLALAARHMPALHLERDSLQFPSSKDTLETKGLYLSAIRAAHVVGGWTDAIGCHAHTCVEQGCYC